MAFCLPDCGDVKTRHRERRALLGSLPIFIVMEWTPVENSVRSHCSGASRSGLWDCGVNEWHNGQRLFLSSMQA